MENVALIPMILIMLALLACSAFFSGSETALMAVSRLRLRQMRKAHPRKVGIVENVLKKPEKLITTILLGNNLVNVGMSALATAVAISLWDEAGIVYVTAVLTIVILLFAEIIPKIYARHSSDRISLFSGPVLNIIMKVLSPVVTGVSWVAGKLLRLAGIDINRPGETIVTEAEVKAVISMSREDGGISAEEKTFLSRVFSLNDKSVADIMIPARRMKTLLTSHTIDDALRIIKQSGHSRFPVRDAATLGVIGSLHAKDLLGKYGRSQLKSIRSIIRPALFTTTDRKINSQLRQFKVNKAHMAVVLDDENRIAGLVTMEDVLEELVGSIEDEYDWGDA